MSLSTAEPAPLGPTQDVRVPEELRTIVVLEVYYNDPRPTFILDIEDLRLDRWSPIYSNPACANSLSSTIVLRDDDVHGPFRAWAVADDAPTAPSYRYNGKFWTCYDLRSKWRVISGTRVTFDDKTRAILPARIKAPIPRYAGAGPTEVWKPTSPPASTIGPAYISPDTQAWADSMPTSPFISDFFKRLDWASTSLGDIMSWPFLLRRSVRFVLADPMPACLFWGEDEICIFNSGYADILSERAASCLGRPAAAVWPEIYEKLQLYIEEVKRTHASCSWRNVQFLIHREGIIAETYWDWSLIPLMEDGGKSSGLYSSIHETTQSFISDRRAESLLSPVHTQSVTSFWSNVARNFEMNPWDAPMAAFYDVSHARRLSASSAGSNDDSGCYCVLRSTIGVPAGHKAFPKSADVRTSSTNGVLPYLAEAASQRESLILTSATHPSFFALLDGVQWAGFGVSSTTVVVFCLRAAKEIIGFVILGLNPRRPYNDAEHRFVEILDNQLSAALSTTVLLERAQLTEVRLQDQLSQRIVQLEMSDARYRAITDLNPLGTINITPDGTTLYANKRWYDITGHPPTLDVSKIEFRNVILEEDLDVIDRELHEIVVNKKQRYYEVRLQRQWYDEVERRWEHRWLQCTGGPEIDELGDVVSVIGCITDISKIKHAETIQARHRQAAEEAKVAQERYMDVTSHEMRNPLSAILQSADDISSSLKESLHAAENQITFAQGTIDNCLDAAGVISLCAQHQTRIINDVLTLSKLDSKLLEVCPVPAQPLAIIQETLHMHAAELVSNDIQIDLEMQPSYGKHGIDWVFCDPSRLKQILINLMGNAIKFTRTQETRKIAVELAASVVKPPKSSHHDIEWFPSKKFSLGSRRDLTQDAEWGDGEPVFIAVMVSDTGKGLSADEKKRLFRRFAQANTLTHVHYGGSGLGLFISRELTEMQGGEIGVTSQAGKGSTFAFFIKARRAKPPTDTQTAENKASGTAAGIQSETGNPPSRNKGVVPMMPTSPPKENALPQKTNLAILLVEDNLVNQKVMTKQLTKAGARVSVANHGQEALNYIEKTILWRPNAGKGEPVDLALVDVEMPVMNGTTCARRIRELQKLGMITSHLPLVAVTANARKEQIDDCLAAGMDDYMIKPFRVPDLLAKVEKLMAAQREHNSGLAGEP